MSYARRLGKRPDPSGAGEPVTLARSEVARLADALAPVVARYRSRREAAKAIGVGLGQIQRVVARGACVVIKRGNLARLGEVAGVDTSGWGA